MYNKLDCDLKLPKFSTFQERSFTWENKAVEKSIKKMSSFS